MSAPEGNQFWKARSKHGRDKLFASSQALLEACYEYFDWVEKNPLWENRVTQFQGAPVDMPVAKMRAMTIDGLCTFLDIDNSTWHAWQKSEDFSDVTKKVDRIIRDQKFSGAAADLLNANIIARDLGLKDSASVEHSGSIGIADAILAARSRSNE